MTEQTGDKAVQSSSKKIDSIDNIIVSCSVLENLFNLSDRMIRMLAEDGIITKEKRGRYNLVESVKKYIIHIRANNEFKEIKTDEVLNKDREQALHERVKREIAELRLAAMKGNMHRAEDVERVMNDMLASFRSKILALPSKLAPILIARDDISQIQLLIKKEVFEVLEELSVYDPQKFYSEEYIDASDDDSDITVDSKEFISPGDMDG
jgi:phage terminase Nu1 subunit (DNA packaging protein)